MSEGLARDVDKLADEAAGNWSEVTLSEVTLTVSTTSGSVCKSLTLANANETAEL